MVSSRIEDGIRRLFDSPQPYLASWLQLHDVDDVWFSFGNDHADLGSPLYYASLCRFRDLAARIIINQPEQMNASGCRNHSPLVAASARRIIDLPGYVNRTPLLAALKGKLVDVARWLLDHGADADLQDDEHWNPILQSASSGSLELVKMLLERGIYINSGRYRPYSIAPGVEQWSRGDYEAIDRTWDGYQRTS